MEPFQNASSSPVERKHWPPAGAWRRLPAPAPRTREAIRRLERRALEELGVPELLLMENAGAGAARIIGELCLGDPVRYPEPFIVLCGPGNNGGDGFVVARHLSCAGFAVSAWVPPGCPYPPGGAARAQLEIARRMGLALEEDPGAPLPGRGTIVDALFGIGLSRPLAPPYLERVASIHRSGLAVISLDVPSGLDADTGAVLGDAVRAIHTITFLAPKVGFQLASGPERCGEVHVVDIGIPVEPDLPGT